MNCISLDMGCHDIYFNDIASEVVTNCDEEEFLLELSRQNERIAKESGDLTEKTFAAEASTRLRDLAQWFKENQP